MKGCSIVVVLLPLVCAQSVAPDTTAPIPLRCSSVDLLLDTSCGGVACDSIDTTYLLSGVQVGAFHDGERIITALNESLCKTGAVNDTASYVCLLEDGVATADAQVCSPVTDSPESVLSTPSPDSGSGMSVGAVIAIVLVVICIVAVIAATIFRYTRRGDTPELGDEGGARAASPPRKDGLSEPLIESVMSIDANAHQKASQYYDSQPAFNAPKGDPDLLDFV